ncbi:hypothetical protein [Mycolicibacterium llatzerense]|uniref:hypothetical protein n=1 Tax=Mycolicibacterium llatzerense TaxID=280871 RepID=UPI0021B6E078|nr:hypothetical protein [Mycolicibacterium llatzerense]MCT7361321.1 hypothetical protein [Mycolicibacterium llatzerense]
MTVEIGDSYELAQAVRKCIAGIWDQLADVFDWLAPGMSEGLRAMLLGVQDTLENWVYATAIYGTAGAATELDYYTDAPRVRTWQHCRKGLITGAIVGETPDGYG